MGKQKFYALNISSAARYGGVRRDENNAFIRLADALCGLVRDARDENAAAAELLRILQKKKVVTSL